MARPRSLQLLLDDIPDEVTGDGPSVVRVTIFNSLVTAGILRDEIEGIECLSKKLWFVVFCDRTQRQKYIDSEIRLFEKTYWLKSTDPPRIQRPNYTFVKIFGYPLDTRADILEQCMRVYGDLIDIRDDVDNTINIKTGVKTATYTKLNEDIPSFVYAGRYHVRTSYRGQPKTCRNCGKTGHVVKDCQAGKVCRICGEPGHVKGECPERRCFYCKGRGHEQNNCDQYREDFPAFGGDDDNNELGPPRGWGDPIWQQRVNEEQNHGGENMTTENGQTTATAIGSTDDGGTGTTGNETQIADDRTRNTANDGTDTVDSGTQVAEDGVRGTDNNGTATVESGAQDANGGIRNTDNGGTETVEDGAMITDENTESSGGVDTPKEQTIDTSNGSGSGITRMETENVAENQNNATGKERVTDGDSSDEGEAPKRLKNNAEESVKVPEKPTDTDNDKPREKGVDSSDENENPENPGQKKPKRKGRNRNKRKPATVVSQANNRNPFFK